jgi:hypothetical protein
MFSLTDSLDINQLLEFHHSLVFHIISLLDDDYRIKVVLWHELAFETQKYYEIVIDFFRIWCIFNNQTSWSTTLKNLKKWVVNKMYESTLSKQHKIKMIIIQKYLFDIKSYHVDYLHNLNVFDHSQLQKVLKEKKRMFSIIKITRLSVIKNILQLIIQFLVIIINDINFDIACKIA